MRRFRWPKDKIASACLELLRDNIDDEERLKIDSIFTEIDINNSQRVTKPELRHIYRKYMGKAGGEYD